MYTAVSGYSALLILLLASCGKNDPDNRYTMLSRHWVEVGREVDGKAEKTTQLQHIFHQSGNQGKLYYEFVCGVPCAEGAAGQPYQGSWQLLSDDKLSTSIDGAIRIYIIKKLTTTQLWLQEEGTAVLSKLERFR